MLKLNRYILLRYAGISPDNAFRAVSRPITRFIRECLRTGAKRRMELDKGEPILHD